MSFKDASSPPLSSEPNTLSVTIPLTCVFRIRTATYLPARVCARTKLSAFIVVGIDLQKEVHEDMVRNFSVYPNQRRWLLAHTDTNIDHRRVPNLMKFFSRKGESLGISSRAADYTPGDLVTWDLGGNVPHIGMVVGRKSSETGRYLIVHNIGRGPQMEDVLFQWKITGHYRYFRPAN